MSIFPRRTFAESGEGSSVVTALCRRVADRASTERGDYNLIRDRDRSPAGNGLEEILGHELRHSNATVRCGIARQITGVHSNTIDDAHEERHRRAFKMRSWRFFIVHGNVRHYDVAGVINKVAIFG